MKRLFQGLGLPALLAMLLGVCVVVPQASAAQFTISWSGEVESRTGDLAVGLFNVGDNITASGVFDDASTVMTSIEYGIPYTYNIVPDYVGIDDIFDDVAYDFSDNLQALIDGTDGTYVDLIFSWYFHDLVGDSGGGGHYLQYRDPGIEIVLFGADDGTGNWSRIKYAIDHDPTFGVDLINVTYSIEPASSEPVPEPVTMLLFASGLVGLASSGFLRRK